MILGESFHSRVNYLVDFITASRNILVTKQPVYQDIQIETDKAFGFLLVYNYFRQLSTFLPISSELDTGLALFCF